jgi:four helix bundle protein
MGAGYKDLRVWQQSVQLTLDVYKAIEKFPRKEQYQLISQMCRAAVSIPSNIAEGKGRHTSKEFAQFLHTARGSLYELETQLLISHKLNYLNMEDWTMLMQTCETIGRALNGLIYTVQGVKRIDTNV